MPLSPCPAVNSSGSASTRGYQVLVDRINFILPKNNDAPFMNIMITALVRSSHNRKLLENSAQDRLTNPEHWINSRVQLRFRTPALQSDNAPPLLGTNGGYCGRNY